MMRQEADLRPVRSIIEAEQTRPSSRALAMCAAIRARHGDTIRAFLLYGSGLREADDHEKLLDFYVLVDNYTAIHGRGAKALGAFLVPPSVHYMEIIGPDAMPIRSKYSIISLSAFHRRASGRSLEAMLWARFAQPAVVISDDPDIRNDIFATLSRAVTHFANESLPLLQPGSTSRDLWIRGLVESYRSELRAENPETRAAELVDRYRDRYDALATALFGRTNSGAPSLPTASWSVRQYCRLRWFARRMIGKPMTAIRVLKAVFTFDGGLDYVLHKLHSHSGVTIAVTNAQRRHPLRYSPLLAWKLYRKGAFR
jgi:hypothetical protein